MKLKTALELLGDDGCMKCFGGMGCDHDLELVARRAREEAYEMAVAEVLAMKDNRNYVSRVLLDIAAEHIRALPTEPK